MYYVKCMMGQIKNSSSSSKECVRFKSRDESKNIVYTIFPHSAYICQLRWEIPHPHVDMLPNTDSLEITFNGPCILNSIPLASVYLEQ